MSAILLYCSKCQIALKGESGYKRCLICGTKLIKILDPNIKCPTCNSNNIVPVTQTKREFSAFLFGIANPTARAQFECKNCGYKW